MPRLNETDATVEQRARAVRYWEQEVRPQMAAKEQSKLTEDPYEALARLKEEGWGDLQVSDAVLATIPRMGKGQPA
jgi:sulfur relay (sulfurtransferase) DsrC/TusE family protein